MNSLILKGVPSLETFDYYCINGLELIRTKKLCYVALEYKNLIYDAIKRDQPEVWTDILETTPMGFKGKFISKNDDVFLEVHHLVSIQTKFSVKLNEPQAEMLKYLNEAKSESKLKTRADLERHLGLVIQSRKSYSIDTDIKRINAAFHDEASILEEKNITSLSCQSIVPWFDLVQGVSLWQLSSLEREDLRKDYPDCTRSTSFYKLNFEIEK